MEKQENITAQKRFGTAVNSGDLDALNELVSPDVFDHDPAYNQAPGAQGYIDFFGALRDAFPDMRVEVDQLVADEDCVAFAYTLTGTNYGEFKGMPASNRGIKVRGMQISRFKDGKLIERWGSSDELGILKQLGFATELEPR